MRVSTTIAQALDAVQQKIISDGNLGTDEVFISFTPDYVTYPIGEIFALIVPQRMYPNPFHLEGAGNAYFELQSNLQIRIWFMNIMDRTNHDTQLMRSNSRGVNMKIQDMVNSLSIYDPADSSIPPRNIFTEPMRLMRVTKAARHADAKQWSYIDTFWQITFTIEAD